MVKELLYGVAYYDEYMPENRLAKDIDMMKKANINLVRIGESTWSTYEPTENNFDFSSLERVMDAMHAAGIKVIVGTPTYAIPAWLSKKHPEVMVTDSTGQKKYGARQIMDITSPAFLYYAERIIRKQISIAAKHPAVIGFQVDNETKHYGTCSQNVQIDFVNYMKKRFNNDLEQLNMAYGLNYWSNRIENWEDFPAVDGTINGSLGSAFSEFQRTLVTDYLNWQINIVKEYAREEQFITHNFDFEWRGYSYGVQPDVDHFITSENLDIVGIDVYHPSQDDLTGAEIAFTGDIARCLKDDNYFVLETEAQAFKQWTPYPGQLRLQAFAHISSGASMVEYWHWHSIHNSFETYWKGLLSHDMKPNPVYNEAVKIGNEFKQLSKVLSGFKKVNKVAIIVSNESLTAIDWFPFEGNQMDRTIEHQYNDVFRAYYDALYKMNIEVDILKIGDSRIKRYDLLIVPALYSASDDDLKALNEFVAEGGTLVATFKSGFTDENVKVRTSSQPAILTESLGVEYQLFSQAKDIKLTSNVIKNLDSAIPKHWIELLTLKTAKSLSNYDHSEWGKYAAITENNYGEGKAYYIGTHLESEDLIKIFEYIVHSTDLDIVQTNDSFPIVHKYGKNENGQMIEFIFNYSCTHQKIQLKAAGYELFDQQKIATGSIIELEPWGVRIIKR